MESVSNQARNTFFILQNDFLMRMRASHSLVATGGWVTDFSRNASPAGAIDDLWVKQRFRLQAVQNSRQEIRAILALISLSEPFDETGDLSTRVLRKRLAEANSRSGEPLGFPFPEATTSTEIWKGGIDNGSEKMSNLSGTIGFT
jgi:hypothetical protein